MSGKRRSTIWSDSRRHCSQPCSRQPTGGLRPPTRSPPSGAVSSSPRVTDPTGTRWDSRTSSRSRAAGISSSSPSAPQLLAAAMGAPSSKQSSPDPDCADGTGLLSWCPFDRLWRYSSYVSGTERNVLFGSIPRKAHRPVLTRIAVTACWDPFVPQLVGQNGRPSNSRKQRRRDRLHYAEPSLAPLADPSPR
jgi:hypothetical protein